MEIEYDPVKDAVNLKKHGLSLAFGSRIFDDPRAIVIKSVREGDGEERRKAIGRVGTKLYTVVHVLRGDVVRYISVRRSNDGEDRIYHRP